MTLEQFQNLQFRFASHMALDDMHTTTYVNDQYGIAFTEHVTYRNGHPSGRCYTHYRIGFAVYKTQASLIEALQHIPYQDKTHRRHEIKQD